MKEYITLDHSSEAQLNENICEAAKKGFHLFTFLCTPDSNGDFYFVAVMERKISKPSTALQFNEMQQAILASAKNAANVYAIYRERRDGMSNASMVFEALSQLAKAVAAEKECNTSEPPTSAQLTKEDYETLKKAHDWLVHLGSRGAITKGEVTRETWNDYIDTRAAIATLRDKAGRL